MNQTTTRDPDGVGAGPAPGLFDDLLPAADGRPGWLRDVEALLNTRAADDLPDGHPLAAGFSAYGLPAPPDVTAESGAGRCASLIARQLARFEPRLRNPVVTPAADGEGFRIVARVARPAGRRGAWTKLVLLARPGPRGFVVTIAQGETP